MMFKKCNVQLFLLSHQEWKIFNYFSFFRSTTTINNCDEIVDYLVSLYLYLYTRLCLPDQILEALPPVAAAGGVLAAGSLLATPPLPMTLASGVPPGLFLLLVSFFNC